MNADLVDIVVVFGASSEVSDLVRDGGGVVQLSGTSRQFVEHFGVPTLPLGSVKASPVSIDGWVLQHLTGNTA